MFAQDIVGRLADLIGDSEPLTTKQCVDGLSDEYSEKAVLAELEACKKLEALGHATRIVFDTAVDRWCLAGQRLADQEEPEDE